MEPQRTSSRRNRASAAGYGAGIVLLISGTTGSTALYRLGYDVISGWLPALDTLLFIVLAVVGVLASLGGLTVIWAAWLAARGSRRRAKALMTLGVGTGLLGLALHLLLTTVEGGNPVGELLATATTLSGLGVFLSIYARALI